MPAHRSNSPTRLNNDTLDSDQFCIRKRAWSAVRYYEEILLPWLLIWNALEDGGEGIGEQEGENELHCSSLAETENVIWKENAIHSSIEAPVSEDAYSKAVILSVL